jgi:hypothetical protein
MTVTLDNPPLSHECEGAFFESGQEQQGFCPFEFGA